MKIDTISLNIIFDSRGERTIDVVLGTKKGFFHTAIPSGKSRGTGEAFVQPPEKTGRILGTIKGELIGHNFPSVSALDRRLLELDGTADKHRLGGNLMLGISIAFAKALAADKKVPLWKILKSEFFAKGKESTPLIFSNLVNGGLHAKNDLSFQEYMVVVKKSGSYEKTIGDLIHFYRTLGEKLTEDYKISSLPIGDEGGYALNFKNNLEPLVILQDLIEKNNLGGKFSIAIDAAASDFRKDGLYMVDGNPLSTIQLAALYRDYLEKIPRIISIEDPFHESDYDGFRAFRKLAPKTVTVGDDITVTSRERILQCADDGLITGVIIKPNQIGTVSETCAAISAAQEKGVKVITSHRSGETEDAFIIHFAKACGAWGIKIGAPAKERLIKYNEIIRIFDL